MRRRTLLVLLITLAALPACGSSSLSRPHCRRSARLVPSCGVLWGVVPEPNTLPALAGVEQRAGTRFSLAYHFADLDERVPSADERQVVASGRVLHISIDSRIFGKNGRTVLWSAVTAGEYDQALEADASGIASLHVPVFVTFDHEADQPRHAAAGTPAQFVAAWRHVHDLFVAHGATNAVWVWVVTGYPNSFATAGQLWPGNDVVDWISWEAYNGSGCVVGDLDPARYASFAQTVLPFYRWLHGNAARLHIDASKPMMLSEAGSVEYPGDAAKTAGWYRGIPAVLRMHPQIKAIALWDRPGIAGCAYRWDGVPAVATAVRVAGASLTVQGR